MLSALEIENFRGIERLALAGLGRVNLIIGKNDAGKTTAMEALAESTTASRGGSMLLTMQSIRGVSSSISDFDNYWRPIFREGNAERGYVLRATNEHGVIFHIEVRKEDTPVIVSGGASGLADPSGSTWRIGYRVESDGRTIQFSISKTSGEAVALPPPPPPPHGFWVSPERSIGSNDIKLLSEHKQAGRDRDVSEMLRIVNPTLESVEILAPTGRDAALFVRSRGGLLLPFSSLGQGTQRCFEMANIIASPSVDRLSIDEIENGLHHSVLVPVWSWLRAVSLRRGVQVFATTHSEECVQAAAEAFHAAEDDGLRVIRLDRRAHEVTATVYQPTLVADAAAMGVEIRG